MTQLTVEIISGLAMILAVVGCIKNNNRRRVGFLFWLVSNMLCLTVHLSAGLWLMAVKDIVFLGLAFAGWRKWSKSL